MVEVYLLYFLIIALWCKMCRKCLRFCHLKHWRVCICIVSLESLCLVILLIAMHTVSQKVSWHRTQILPFTLWPPLWITYYSSQMPTLLFKEVCKGEKTWKNSFYSDDLSQYVSAQSVLTLSICSRLINFSLLLLTAMQLCSLCRSNSLDCCCVLSRGNQTSA